MGFVAAAILGMITIARLHAMHQRSRKVLIFLVVVFLAIHIACIVIGTIDIMYVAEEGLILPGIYLCNYGINGQLLRTIVWTHYTVWEVLALCLTVRIAVKQFRKLQQFGPLTGRTISNIFRVLLQTHVVYFASFIGASCFNIGTLSSHISTSTSTGTVVYEGICEIFMVVQMFVLGSRLILSVREHHAKLVSDFDTGTALSSIVFQDRIHMQTGSSV